MASVAQLGYLGLDVTSLANWESFATEVLGLQVAANNPDGALCLRADENHHRFILQQGSRDDVAFLGWEVADQGALRELAAQLRADGVDVSEASADDAQARGVVELIRFNDPNDIASEAYYGPTMNFETPFRSPRPISGFETGTMGWATSFCASMTPLAASTSTATCSACVSATSSTCGCVADSRRRR